MPFPISPTAGATTTTNNINYIYAISTGTGVGYWTRVLSTSTTSGGGTNNNTSTTSLLPPTTATVGDIWYAQGTDVVYRYEFDGISRYWIDFNGPTGGGGGSGGSSTPFTGGSITNSVQIQSSLTVATTILVGTGTTTATQVGLIV